MKNLVVGIFPLNTQPMKRISSQLRWFETTMQDFWVLGILSPLMCQVILLVSLIIQRLKNTHVLYKWKFVFSIKTVTASKGRQNFIMPRSIIGVAMIITLSDIRILFITKSIGDGKKESIIIPIQTT